MFASLSLHLPIICKNTISAPFLRHSTSHYLSSPMLAGRIFRSSFMHSRLKSIRVHLPPHFFRTGKGRMVTNRGESWKMDRGAICFFATPKNTSASLRPLEQRWIYVWCMAGRGKGGLADGSWPQTNPLLTKCCRPFRQTFIWFLFALRPKL